MASKIIGGDPEQQIVKEFDDIDDAVLKEPLNPEKQSKKSAAGTGQARPSLRTRVKSSAAPGVKPTANLKQKLSDGMKAIVMISATLFVLMVVYVLIAKYQKYGTALVISTAFMISFFLYLFTGAIDKVKMNGMVVYCYLFTSAALLGAILPFFYFEKVVLNQEKMLVSPLGVVNACVRSVAEEQVPPEMDCKRDKAQWVLNIGGTIEVKNLTDCVTPKCVNEDKKQHPERYASNNVQISSGLVIPLYVLVLSIIGAAVNMMRRVPEYQRQAYIYNHDVNASTEPKSDQISFEDAREYMVFQLMQVVSAPLIAITAYYIIVPQSPAVSVALGFFAGFASETTLLAMRAFADKLLPTGVMARTRAGKS